MMAATRNAPNPFVATSLLITAWPASALVAVIAAGAPTCLQIVKLPLPGDPLDGDADQHESAVRVPRVPAIRAIASTTCSPLMPWSTSIASASRV